MKIQYPLLIDGGLSNVLEKNGHDLNHELWSAKLLDENEDAIVQAHIEYLNAGAKCLITSSYQATIPGFQKLGFSEQKSVDLIKKTVFLAKKAINKTKSESFVAASIGPYGAYLSDGSEYRGDYKISDEELHDFHFSRIEILEETDADWYACETIPSFQEAKVLSKILINTSKPAWISFSCKDEKHINDGTPIADCVRYLEDHPNIFAIGLNCTKPQYVSALIQEIRSTDTNKKIVVYPNSGEVFDAKTKTWHDASDAASFSDLAIKWVNEGADLIGGCCRIGPEHISLIHEKLK